LWDSGLIDIRLSRDFNANIVKYYEYIHTIMLHQTHTDGNDNFNKWVNESLAAVCQHVYFDEGNAPMNASMNFTLGNIYYERNIGIVEQRLAQGGRRLGSLLNSLAANRSKMPSGCARLLSNIITLIGLICITLKSFVFYFW
ncbi:unnamed protein product, partial [Rotaria magnacalcarata]